MRVFHLLHHHRPVIHKCVYLWIRGGVFIIGGLHEEKSFDAGGGGDEVALRGE
jgi:hypothetical protein